MFLSSRNIVYATEDKARAITIHMQGLSDEAYYVDLLVKIKTSVLPAANSYLSKQNAKINGFDKMVYYKSGHSFSRN